MSARHVFPSVGEIEILRDKETAVGLRGLPHDTIVLASELFGRHGIDVVSEFSQERDEPMRQVLVQES